MKAINEARLESDLDYRFGYMAEFMGFGPEDVAAIHGAAPAIAPLVPALVDAVYEKLHGYDATWRHFLPRQHGHAGSLPANLDELPMDHEQIRIRKGHLGSYFEALVTRPYDGEMASYLNGVGRIHTTSVGSSEVSVPLVQMSALLGFVADALTATILGLDLERGVEACTLRAFGKLLWLQNDLINRHYGLAARVW